jgi:ubiquinone/menaquinone biosynthesis C-methylase UbiE
VDPEILNHYTQGVEDGRLTEGGSSRIEYARTQELLERVLPEAPARILDIGGGPGRYAAWLAGLGYEVDLIDVVPLHIEQARDRAVKGADFTATLGNARELPSDDSAYDAVLLLGPLYHLPDRADRLTALTEAARVARPDGPVVAAAISRFASLLDGLKTGALSDPDFQAIVKRDLTSGRHVNPTGRPEYFTTAYFHHPDELRDEIAAAGLHLEALFGIEGPGWLLWERWDDAAGRESIMQVARSVEQEQTLIGVSAHMLAVGRQRA